MSTFSEIWFYTKLSSTSALTKVLRILTTEAPVAHQSARHIVKGEVVSLPALQLVSEAHDCARSICAAQSRRQQQTPLSPVTLSRAPNRTRQCRPAQPTARGRNYSARPLWWGQHPSSLLQSNNAHTKHSANVGKAAGTFRSSRAPTESDHHELSSAAHAMHR